MFARREALFPTISHYLFLSLAFSPSLNLSIYSSLSLSISSNVFFLSLSLSWFASIHTSLTLCAAVYLSIPFASVQPYAHGLYFRCLRIIGNTMAANTIADNKVISLSIHIIQIFWQGVLSHMMLSLSLFLIVSFFNINCMAPFIYFLNSHLILIIWRHLLQH